MAPLRHQVTDVVQIEPSLSMPAVIRGPRHPQLYMLINHSKSLITFRVTKPKDSAFTLYPDTDFIEPKKLAFFYIFAKAGLKPSEENLILRLKLVTGRRDHRLTLMDSQKYWAELEQKPVAFGPGEEVVVKVIRCEYRPTD